MYSWTKTCSEKCRANRYKVLSGRYSDTSIKSGTVGAISEMVVGVDLLKNGYAVFRALSQACHCDLVATKGKENIRVEVRTGYKAKNGNLSFPMKKEDMGRQDIYAIYIRTTDEIFYLTPDKKPYRI